MKKISVIVPAYNAHDTIDECLTSITSQTIFADMELLIVDDCSTDDTVDRAGVYEKRFPDNIMLIKLEKNQGPGYARNVAMEYANGEYVGFVDSDDAVVPAMYEKLYVEATKIGADVVDGGFYDQAKDNAIIYTSDDLTGVPDDHKRSVLITSGGYIWSKLYRRSFLLEEDIRFREEYVLEDMDFLMEVICKMKSITNVKEILYIYRDSVGSLSKTVDVDEYMRSAISAMKAIYKKLSCLPCYEGVCEAVEYTILQLYSFSVNINLSAVKEGKLNRECALINLSYLRELRFDLARIGYNNLYVRNKISSVDLRIMMENDISPDRVLSRV